MCRKSKLKDSEDITNCVKNNNLADYLKHFSDQSKLKKYLKSSFVYSLPEQNLTAAGNPGNRQRLDSWCNEDVNFVAIPNIIMDWIWCLCSSCRVLFICFYRFGWHILHVWTFDRVIGFVRQPLDPHLTRIAPQVNFLSLYFLIFAIVLAVINFAS